MTAHTAPTRDPERDPEREPDHHAWLDAADKVLATTAAAWAQSSARALSGGHRRSRLPKFHGLSTLEMRLALMGVGVGVTGAARRSSHAQPPVLNEGRIAIGRVDMALPLFEQSTRASALDLRWAI